MVWQNGWYKASTSSYMTTFCLQAFGNQCSITGLHYIAPTAVHTQWQCGKFQLTIITM